MYLISIFTILLLKIPLGITANGATRWLNIGGIQFQVAEIVKISVIIMLSYMVQHYAKHVDTLALTIRLWCTGGFVAFLYYWLQHYHYWNYYLEAETQSAYI